MLPIYEAFIRLLLGALVGMAIGFTRRHYPAGIRTFALICLGSTIFTLISIDESLGGDKSRIIGQIVTGIGFLGLGVIWKQGLNKPAGLTTAAAMWVTASIGVLIGLAFWVEVVFAALFTMLILYSNKPLKAAHIE